MVRDDLSYEVKNKIESRIGSIGLENIDSIANMLNSEIYVPLIEKDTIWILWPQEIGIQMYFYHELCKKAIEKEKTVLYDDLKKKVNEISSHQAYPQNLQILMATTSSNGWNFETFGRIMKLGLERELFSEEFYNKRLNAEILHNLKNYSNGDKFKESFLKEGYQRGIITRESFLLAESSRLKNFPFSKKVEYGKLFY